MNHLTGAICRTRSERRNSPPPSTASATRAALQEIAEGSDLGTREGAIAAIRESAGYMISSRLNKRFRDTKQGAALIETLSEYVSNDPLLNSKILSILKKIKAV